VVIDLFGVMETEGNTGPKSVVGTAIMTEIHGFDLSQISSAERQIWIEGLAARSYPVPYVVPL
jgi:hypothetical protein